MINFSLSRNLIERYRPELSPRAVSDELRRFADEVELYRSLPEREAEIAKLLADERYRIFAKK
jgi:hypothetical protein